MSDTAERKYNFVQAKYLRSSIFFLLALISLIVSYCYFVFDITSPLYVGIGYCMAMLACAFIYIKMNLFFIGRYIAFFVTCTISMILSYLEGFEGLVFLYFLPIVVIIQILITKKDRFRSQALLFYGTFSFFLLITLIITSRENTQNYSESQIEILRFINLSVVFLLILFYSLFGVIQERWYFNKLKKGAEEAEEMKNKRMAMLSNLGHEIRTQATSINAASVMLSETKVTDEQRPLIEVLENCTSQMFYLINDILDLRKIETEKFRLNVAPKNLKQILAVAAVPFRERTLLKGLQFNLEIDEAIEGYNVMVDESRLMQVLHNLLSNALKYTNNGSITFSSGFLSETDNSITVSIEVCDTGIGINTENLNKIFDSFWQVKSDDVPIYGGSGLGLTIASNIVAEMGSKLKVESVKDKGSKFHFIIKLAKSPDKIESEKEVMQTDLANTDILVVDDNSISLTFATKLLQKKGMNVRQAKNGREAIDVFKMKPETPLILLDLEMPEMNGYAAIAELKKLNPDVIVIAFTANIPDHNFNEKLARRGFADVLSKPYQAAKLYEKIAQYL